MRLIGLMCKRCEAFSLQVLIGRGLDHMLCVKQKHKHESTLFDFEVTVSSGFEKNQKKCLTNSDVCDII